ncbi:unnamed protein product [Effrenium voratum]|nr:unnamed protein product [Effrenium voratum]
MFPTLCQELHELFQEDDAESCFSTSDEEGLEHRRPREPHALDDYFADEDGYEMVVESELPDVVARNEVQLIRQQIAQLSRRLRREGQAEVLDHYHKVKADLFLQLATTLRAQFDKQDDTDDVASSSLSTCDTLEHRPLAGEQACTVVRVPPSTIMGPQMRRSSTIMSSDVTGSIV